jgi:hypothetical protein
MKQVRMMDHLVTHLRAKSEIANHPGIKKVHFPDSRPELASPGAPENKPRSLEGAHACAPEVPS